MKYLKKYMLLLSALGFILLGAALPYVTAQMQDANISQLQKKLELSTVNLTLRHESDVLPVLQMISKEHTESVWEGETVLTTADASRAALAVMEALDQYGLLPEGNWEILRGKENVTAHLLVAGDGSSALIWSCIWDCSPGTFITIDDATGKAVRILTDNVPKGNHIGVDAFIQLQLEKWASFLPDYYAVELTDIKESGDGQNAFVMCFSSKDSAADYNLNLKIAKNFTLFNYQ